LKKMPPDKQRKIALRLGLLSALVMIACTAWLVAEYAVTARREATGKSLVESLQERVKAEYQVAEELHGERDRLTEGSLSRESRSRLVAWTLLVAGGAFVASGKWFMTLRPQRLPALDDLVAVRFALAVPSFSGRPRTAATEQEEIDLSFVDGLVERLDRSREAAIPILQAIQTHYRFLPDEALRRVCELTEITPAQIAGTSGFYAQFRRSPVGRHVVRVCHGTACHVAGADQITQELRRHLGISPGEDTDPRRLFTIDKVACVGCCSLAPVMMIEEETAGRLTPASARQVLDSLEPPS
jgi:NADH:ubiquinone oxidoreductase subunit E